MRTIEVTVWRVLDGRGMELFRAEDKDEVLDWVGQEGKGEVLQGIEQVWERFPQSRWEPESYELVEETVVQSEPLGGGHETF